MHLTNIRGVIAYVSDVFLELTSKNNNSKSNNCQALTGGENAYFVACQNWLGVADGVGHWSLEGNSFNISNFALNNVLFSSPVSYSTANKRMNFYFLHIILLCNIPKSCSSFPGYGL